MIEGEGERSFFRRSVSCKDILESDTLLTCFISTYTLRLLPLFITLSYIVDTVLLSLVLKIEGPSTNLLALEWPFIDPYVELLIPLINTRSTEISGLSIKLLCCCCLSSLISDTAIRLCLSSLVTLTTATEALELGQKAVDSLAWGLSLF